MVRFGSSCNLDSMTHYCFSVRRASFEAQPRESGSRSGRRLCHPSPTSPSAQSDGFNADEKQHVMLGGIESSFRRIEVHQSSSEGRRFVACATSGLSPQPLRRPVLLPPCTAVMRLVGSGVTDTHCARPNCAFSPPQD